MFSFDLSFNRLFSINDDERAWIEILLGDLGQYSQPLQRAHPSS